MEPVLDPVLDPVLVQVLSSAALGLVWITPLPGTGPRPGTTPNPTPESGPGFFILPRSFLFHLVCLAKSFWVHLNLPVSIFVCWHPPLLVCLHLCVRWPVYPLSCRLVFPVHFPACLI